MDGEEPTSLRCPQEGRDGRVGTSATKPCLTIWGTHIFFWFYYWGCTDVSWTSYSLWKLKTQQYWAVIYSIREGDHCDNALFTHIEAPLAWVQVHGEDGQCSEDEHPIAFEHQKKLSLKQARRHDFLAEFDYVLKYKPWRANLVVDALSRKVELVAMSRIQRELLTLINERT